MAPPFSLLRFFWPSVVVAIVIPPITFLASALLAEMGLGELLARWSPRMRPIPFVFLALALVTNSRDPAVWYDLRGC